MWKRNQCSLRSKCLLFRSVAAQNWCSPLRLCATTRFLVFDYQTVDSFAFFTTWPAEKRIPLDYVMRMLQSALKWLGCKGGKAHVRNKPYAASLGLDRDRALQPSTFLSSSTLYDIALEAMITTSIYTKPSHKHCAGEVGRLRHHLYQAGRAARNSDVSSSAKLSSATHGFESCSKLLTVRLKEMNRSGSKISCISVTSQTFAQVVIPGAPLVRSLVLDI
ncbi:hypothetical protein BV22DRAFT_191008 [Leucogyrophana mollusca]|uniref:Uncharacterized protein n=1 Tax=Leucogyrophana mollusca TaxID=85980 RepID=A0ACB8BTR4_9AGAM|nr:hypothetical protein BV22DRAFT_191008 [Leucogyrophana mollusca]